MMDRRTVIAAAAVLPVTGAVALTRPPADPAVAAFQAWRAAFIAYERSLDRPDIPDGCPIVAAAQRAEWDTMVMLASMTATSPAGLAGQLFAGLSLFGCRLDADTDWNNPEDYKFGDCRDDVDGRMYRNMLAGCEAMAGVAS